MNEYTSFKNTFDTLRAEVAKHVVGAKGQIDLAPMAVLTGLDLGYEGDSGIGKTFACEVAAKAAGLETSFVPMSAEVEPAEITGNMVFDQSTGKYRIHPGAFSHQGQPFVVLDELNRARTKVHNALLDILNSRRCVVGGHKMPFSELATVMYTMNPPESEGTRELPRALRDRLDGSLWVDRPNAKEDAEITNRTLQANEVTPVIDSLDIKRCRQLFADATKLASSEAIAEAARITALFGTDNWEVKASPRTTISIVRLATAFQLVETGKAAVSVESIREFAYLAVRHNVVPTDWLSSQEREQMIIETIRGTSA